MSPMESLCRARGQDGTVAAMFNMWERGHFGSFEQFLTSLCVQLLVEKVAARAELVKFMERSTAPVLVPAPGGRSDAD